MEKFLASRQKYKIYFKKNKNKKILFLSEPKGNELISCQELSNGILSHFACWLSC